MKKFKRITALVIAAVLTLSMSVYYGGNEVQAAKKGKVTSVKVTNLKTKTLILKKGRTKVLKVSVKTTGKNVSKGITFKSSNKKVVTVSKSGKNVKLKAKKNGKANITIKSKAAPKKKVVIKVTVGTPVKKVTLNKTNATLLKGKTLQLNASVTPKNASNKKVVWSTSSSKIATVNSKGVVTAKSAGTATIKATAADGSGKKATCKITVTDPTDIKDISVMNSNTIRVTLTKAQSLQANAFTVKTKYYSNGIYNRTCKIQSVYSTDKTNYYIVLDSKDYISRGTFVQITVNGLAGNNSAKVKEAEYKYTVATYNYHSFARFEYNEEVDDYEIYCGNGVGYMSATWTNLPAGLKAEWDSSDSSVYISGKPTTKGNHTTVFTFKDEIGNVYKENVTFMTYSSTNIVAATAPVYTAAGADQTAYVESCIYVGGESGDYKYEIVGNTYGLSIDGDGYVYGNLAVGTYNVNVKVTDNANTTLTTTCTLTINIKKGMTVKGVVKDISGKTVSNAYVYLDNISYGDPYMNSYGCTTDEKGCFTAVVANGNYDIYAVSGTCESNYLFNQNITSDKSDLALTINGYKVTITLKDSDIDIDDFSSWRDSEGKNYGYGSEICLKAGTYELTSKYSLLLVEYVATVSMTVNGPSAFVATVTKNEASVNDIVLNEPVYANLTGQISYYKFVPEESGTYYFCSIDGDDPEGMLYDENGGILVSGDDEYDMDFCFDYYCEAGETYYFGVRTYEGSESTSIMISDENYYSE